MPLGTTARSAGRATAAAGAKSRPNRTPPDLPADPGPHAAKLRAQGQSSDQIRGALTTMGYPPATVANVVPGNPGRRSTRPAATPAAVEPTTPPAAVEPTSTAPASSSALPNLDTGSAAGFLLGLVGTAVLINFMRAGVPGVKIWFGAKFLNITGAPASTTPAPRAGPGGTIQPGPSYTSPDGGKNFDPSAGAGSSGV